MDRATPTGTFLVSSSIGSALRNITAACSQNPLTRANDTSIPDLQCERHIDT